MADASERPDPETSPPETLASPEFDGETLVEKKLSDLTPTEKMSDPYVDAPPTATELPDPTPDPIPPPPSARTPIAAPDPVDEPVPSESAFHDAFMQAQQVAGGRTESATERWRKDSPTARLRRGELAAALQAPFLRPLLRFPLRKAAIWTFIGALIYFCRDYFGVIFLTFVISYISTTIVGRISPFFTNRKIPVALVFLVTIGAVVGLGFATVPGAIRQGKSQLDKMRQVKDLRAFVNDRATELVDKIPVLKDWGIVEKLSDPEINKQVVENLKSSKQYVFNQLNFVWASIWGGVVNVLLALIFSFMLVWDMPKLGSSLKKLESSRLSGVWFEVAPSVATFFRLLGRAFEAQTVIAIVNTALTSIGMLILGIDGIGFLALIVFICSFIPIVGMWISTVPICIVALQGGGGIGLVIGVVIMVSLVHFLEAYVLNPKIYGHHMKLHPLAVLVVLYLAGETLGVWGLVVGVPLATYVWRHLIMGEAQEIEVSDELEAVAAAV